MILVYLKWALAQATKQKFARPLAFGRVRSLKIALFPFRTCLVTLYLCTLYFVPFVPWYKVLSRAKRRRPWGPDPQKVVPRYGWEPPKTLLGLIFTIFWAISKASKIHDIFASLQKPPKTRNWSPRSAPGRFWEPFSWILGAILASIFHDFSSIDFASIFHDFL